MKIFLVAVITMSTPVWAQQGGIIEPVPQINVSAHGEVKVVPDRASLQISVQTKAVTAAAAASENARKQKAVIDALRALGIPANDIATTNYNVYPEQRYEPNREPVVVGYNVTNTLTVDVKAVTMVGPAIDASLAKGANMITSLQFYAANTEAARQEGIAQAVRKARADADVAARAAGGTIGGLLEVSIGAYFPPPPRPIEMRMRGVAASAQADTPISAGEQAVGVDVNTRWRFLPGVR